jgi:hypothetical protein
MALIEYARFKVTAKGNPYGIETTIVVIEIIKY